MRRVALAGLLAFAMLTRPLHAQDQSQTTTATKAPSPEENGGPRVHGSADVGYRFTDIDGSEATYRQLFNLFNGLRLFGLELNATGAPGSKIFDTFWLSASGIGDPFPTVQLTLRKSLFYDLRVNWQQSRFFNVTPLTPASIDGLDTQAVTNRHNWNTSKQIGNIAYTLYATNRLRFFFDYDRVTNQGQLQSTRAIDFVGSPAAWGSFARADPYEVVGPVNNEANRVTGGVSYSRDHWTVHYRAGYQTYDETQSLDSLMPKQRSINVGDPATAGEPLSALSWLQSRRLTSPVSELTFVVQPSPRIEWRGGYLYYQYQGPFSMDGAFQGLARTNSAGTAVSPYDVSVSSRGTVTSPNNVLTQGLTIRPWNRWAFDVLYRYSSFSSDATGQVASLLALYPPAQTGVVRVSEGHESDWGQSINRLDLTASFEPIPALSIRPGVTLSRRRVDTKIDGEVDAAASDLERAIWPELSIGYRPSPRFSARGSILSSYSDTTFTRMSPIQRNISRVVVNMEPMKGLSIEAAASRTDAELFATDFVSHTRFGSVMASYAYGDRVSLQGGLDYQSFLGTGVVTFQRGILPIADVPMRDREIDRVWHAGGGFKATNRLGVTVTGNFDQVSGADTILGEPPLYGPESFPYVTGTVYYDVSGFGRISVDLQRTYLLNELLPLNNFSASLLTIRYTRAF